MGDLQNTLPEPEAMEDDALSRFHAQWEVQLREKAAIEEGTRSEVIPDINYCYVGFVLHVVVACYHHGSVGQSVVGCFLLF